MIIKKDIIFDVSNEKLHSHLSGELKDLLKKMLTKKPHYRISIAEIFEHPWMAKYKQQKMKRAYMGYYSDSEEVPENVHLLQHPHPPPIMEEDDHTENILNNGSKIDHNHLQAELNTLAHSIIDNRTSTTAEHTNFEKMALSQT